MEQRRSEILSAAARVYAQHGFRGSTTKRIAQEAGVNEVTIFRHFGSKDRLLEEAISKFAGGPRVVHLPQQPIDPERELNEWAASLLAHLRAMRSMIRTCMGELEERPEMTSCASSAPSAAFAELRNYLQNLAVHGFTRSEYDASAAAAMLIGAVFSDAMGRDMMPQVYPPATNAAALYTSLLLRAVGVTTNNTSSLQK
jgi:AcrR family transcriptional regulator